MAITIVPNSAKITILEKPMVVAKISITLPDNAFLGCSLSRYRFQGDIELNGNSGDSTNNWRIGWIQAQWIETSWGYYRGRNDNDGSIFIQIARPPARTQNACRDAFGSISDIFYNTSAIQFDPDTNTTYPPALVDSPVGNTPGNFPIPTRVSMEDAPYTFWELKQLNSLTKTDNYLHEAQIENHFCTVLTVQDPNGVFHHQAHFYWNVRAQARFSPKVYPPMSVDWNVAPSGINGTSVGKIIQGAPTDRRFINILTAPQTKSCNDLGDDAFTAVSRVGHPNRHESRRWKNFDVRKP